MIRKVSAPKITLEEILHTLKRHLPDLEKDYGVKSMGIFGSYARGETRTRSDVDLLVEFDHAPTLFQFVRLQRHLDHVLGAKVDLVMKSALKPEIGRRILSEVVTV